MTVDAGRFAQALLLTVPRARRASECAGIPSAALCHRPAEIPPEFGRSVATLRSV